MVEHLKNKRPRGRPKGSSQRSIATIVVVKNELAKALDLLEERSKPLHILLANAFEEDVNKTLVSVSKFIPQQLTVEHVESPFTKALQEVQNRLDEKVIEHVATNKENK